MTADLRIALGAMEFGTRIDEATSFALLDQFVDGGGVWIDTADCYAFWLSDDGAGGDSEALIGRWLAARPGMRDRVKIATKAGCEPLTPGVFPGPTTGLSRAAVDTQFEASLRRLGLDSVDLFFAHRDDREVSVEEVAETLGGHAAEGRIGRVGLSNWPVWRAERARAHAESQGLPAADTLQLRYSYLQPRPMVRNRIHDHRMGWITDETIDYLEANPQWEAWAYSPLMQGSYDRDDRDPEEAFDHLGSDRRKAALAEVAGDLGVSRSAVVLAWMVGGDPAIRPIVATSRAAQLSEALDGAHLTLTDDQRAALDDAW
jgi:aryl-alcohol dehydrogenase-like predicted oxidoreductase